MNPVALVWLAVIGAVVSVTALALLVWYGGLYIYFAITRSKPVTHIGQIKRRLFG